MGRNPFSKYSATSFRKASSLSWRTMWERGGLDLLPLDLETDDLGFMPEARTLRPGLTPPVAPLKTSIGPARTNQPPPSASMRNRHAPLIRGPKFVPGLERELEPRGPGVGAAPLNVAMVTETFVPHANGVTTSNLTARKGLFARGHRVTVSSAGRPVLDNEAVHYYGGKVFPLYPDFPIAIYPNKHARESKRAFERQRADLVHVHAPGPMGIRGLLSARRRRLPLVVTYHTFLEPLTRYAPRGLKSFYRAASGAAD